MQVLKRSGPNLAVYRLLHFTIRGLHLAVYRPLRFTIRGEDIVVTSKIGIEEDIDQDLETDEDRGLEIENADEVEIDVHARDPARIGEDANLVQVIDIVEIVRTIRGYVLCVLILRNACTVNSAIHVGTYTIRISPDSYA